MQEPDWFVLPWKHWLFHRLYGIVLVFQGTGGGVDIWLLNSAVPLQIYALRWGCSFLPAFSGRWIAWPHRCPPPYVFC